MCKISFVVATTLLFTGSTIMEVNKLDDNVYEVSSIGNIMHSRETLEGDIKDLG